MIWFRSLIVSLVVLALATNAWSRNPCTSLSIGTKPCDIQHGQVAPWSGVLMTESTARSLAGKEALSRELTLKLELAEKTRTLLEARYEKRLSELEVQLEQAPSPLIENPWFWLSVVGAGVGGVAFGVWVAGN